MWEHLEFEYLCLTSSQHSAEEPGLGGKFQLNSTGEARFGKTSAEDRMVGGRGAVPAIGIFVYKKYNKHPSIG